MQNLIDTPSAFDTPADSVVPSAIIAPLNDSMPLMAPLVVRSSEGLFKDYGPYRGSLKLDAQSTSGAFILLDVQANFGGGIPPHIHSREDETFHITEGRFQIQVGTQIWEAGPGDTLFAPRGIAHSWYCISEEPGRLFILVTPGTNFEAYLLEMTQGKTPSQAMQDSQAIAAFMRMTESYGMTMLPNGIEGTPDRVAVAKGSFIELGDHRGTINVSSLDTGGTFLFGDMEVDFQGGPPPHVHQGEDETFIVQKGRFRVMLGDTVCEAGPGDIVFAPRGFKHCWQCLSEEGGKLLLVVTPGENFESFISEVAGQKLLAPVTPEVIGKLLALGDRHGMQMMPPAW